MSQVLISVIIPVFNCEAYLYRCLDSVVRQTLNDIEIILINDCSIDGSQNIIDDYSRADDRIIPLALDENKGVSTARNTGLDIAKGAYVIFLDADDYWSDDTMLETLFESASKNNADMVNFGLRMLSPKGQKLQVLVNEARIVDLKQDNDWNFNYSPVRHLVSRKLIEEFSIRFDPVLVMGEDCLFNVTLFCYASKLVVLNIVYYNYQISMNSANTSIWSKHKLTCTMLWFENAILVIKNSPVHEYHPRLLQELILERLRMLTQKLFLKAFATYDEEELRDYVDLCARNFSHLDNAYFDSHFFQSGWPTLPRSTVDMIQNKDIAGLRSLYGG